MQLQAHGRLVELQPYGVRVKLNQPVNHPKRVAPLLLRLRASRRNGKHGGKKKHRRGLNYINTFLITYHYLIKLTTLCRQPACAAPPEGRLA